MEPEFGELASAVAASLRAERTALTMRWLDRIAERVALTPNRVFPTDRLLDHMPLLLLGIADFIEDPTLVVSADTQVVIHAMKLGELRHIQGFTEYEILKEFEILGGILFTFLGRLAEKIEAPGPVWTCCAQRLFQAVSVIQQATATRYLQLMAARVSEREDRLRTFDRALTHELRNRIGIAMGAAQLLESIELADADRRRLAGVVARNATGMRMVLDNLLELSRLDTDARHQRHVLLAAAIGEAVRQLRDAAHAEGVEVRVAEDMPDVEVSAAIVELCLINFLSNAIKYRHPDRASFADVRGSLNGNEVIVAVHDNGRGVPVEARPMLFQRFFRAHTSESPDIEGTGLGLSIVQETIRTAGGRVWAEFPEEGGSVFAFALPARRAEDLPT